MYILKNAIISIVRNKGRNLLIGLIVIVISCAVSVTLAINNSSNSLIKSYESKYEVEATISMNRDNMMQNFNPEDRENSRENMQEIFEAANQLTEDDIKNYADSTYVDSYYYTMSVGVNSSDLEKAEMTSSNNDFGDRGPGGKQDFKNQTNGDFTLKGYSSIEAMNEFIEGNYTIVDGEVSEDFEDNSCIINSELATLNKIEVGDTITIVDSEDDSNSYELVVSGIYEEKENEDNGMSMFSNSVNIIVTNTNFISNMKIDNLAKLKADVLVDNDFSRVGLEKKLTEAENIAREKGRVLIVVEPKPSAVLALSDWIKSFSPQLSYEQMKEQNITEIEKPFALVPISNLVVE